MPSGSTTTSQSVVHAGHAGAVSNGGTSRGLPISCFLNEASDSLEGIVGLWNENVWLAARGGGIGSYWGNLRSIGEKVGMNGKTSGVVPFIRVMDSLTLAISQGSLRRGSAAVYLPVNHPEIEEFIEIRRPTGGDPNRKALNLHHGLLISDAFMRAVENDEEWALVSRPRTAPCSARSRRAHLWIRILTARIETGEPYLIFVDHVNNARPEHHKLAGLEVKTSNLCSEITLPTGIDHHGKQRTAVCCLSLAQSRDLSRVARASDLHRGRDALPRQRAAGLHRQRRHRLRRATYAAMRERSVGPGRHGLPLLPAAEQHPARIGDGQGVEQEDVQAHPRPVRRGVEVARQGARRLPGCRRLRHRGALLQQARDRADRLDLDHLRRRLARHRADRRPTSTTTRRCRARSWCAIRTSRSCSTQKGKNDEDTWTSITISQGSVQHLDCLDDHEKAVFKTAFEIDQRWLIEHARRPRALHLPEPVAQHLPAGRRAQARPAPDPHDGVEARREEPLLLPLALASSAPKPSPARRSPPRRSATMLSQLPRLDAPSAAARHAAGTGPAERLRRVP